MMERVRAGASPAQGSRDVRGLSGLQDVVNGGKETRKREGLRKKAPALGLHTGELVRCEKYP